MSLSKQIDKNRMPQHVAIIMDGNGRWAKAHGMERNYGHQEGVTSVRKIVEAARKINLKYLTLYMKKIYQIYLNLQLLVTDHG